MSSRLETITIAFCSISWGDMPNNMVLGSLFRDLFPGRLCGAIRGVFFIFVFLVVVQFPASLFSFWPGGPS